MNAENGRKKIRQVIEAHIADHGLITNPEGLIAKLESALGWSDTLVHNGWSCVRISGKDLKLRGNARFHYGYRCEKHLGGGVLLAQDVAPSPDGDIPVDMLTQYLDQYELVHTKYRRD